jgi:hypothetical protein
VNPLLYMASIFYKVRQKEIIRKVDILGLLKVNLKSDICGETC